MIRIRRKFLASLAQLRRVFPVLPRTTRIMIYNVLVLPLLDYCSCVWSACGTNLQVKLERIQNYAMRMITSAKSRMPSAQLRAELSRMPRPFWIGEKCRLSLKSTVVYTAKLLSICAPNSGEKTNAKLRETRGADNLLLQCPHISFYRNSFEVNGAHIWNKLPGVPKKPQFKGTFKHALREHLLHIV